MAILEVKINLQWGSKYLQKAVNTKQVATLGLQLVLSNNRCLGYSNVTNPLLKAFVLSNYDYQAFPLSIYLKLNTWTMPVKEVCDQATKGPFGQAGEVQCLRVLCCFAHMSVHVFSFVPPLLLPNLHFSSLWLSSPALLLFPRLCECHWPLPGEVDSNETHSHSPDLWIWNQKEKRKRLFQSHWQVLLL